MPREAQPDIDLPYISVIVPFPGVSPEDAERLLVKPLEVQLQTIQGVKHMNAVARQSAAIVTLEFEPNFAKDKALADVRAKVDLARGRFPPDAEEPIIEEQSFSDQPVIGIVLSGPAPERELFAHLPRPEGAAGKPRPACRRPSRAAAARRCSRSPSIPCGWRPTTSPPATWPAVIARNNQLVPGGQPALRRRPVRGEGAGRGRRSPPTSWPCRSRRTATGWSPSATSATCAAPSRNRPSSPASTASRPWRWTSPSATAPTSSRP